jgi:hypothetical protein
MVKTLKKLHNYIFLIVKKDELLQFYSHNLVANTLCKYSSILKFF